MMLMHAIDDTCDPTSRIDHLDISFDKLPELLRDCLGSET